MLFSMRISQLGSRLTYCSLRNAPDRITMSYSLLDNASCSPLRRRTLLSRALKSKAARVGTLGAAFLLLVLMLWSTPSVNRIPLLSFDKQRKIPIHRQAAPKLYDDEPMSTSWEYRKNAVKDAFLHAYHAYEENAFPADEYFPMSKAPRQK